VRQTNVRAVAMPSRSAAGWLPDLRHLRRGVPFAIILLILFLARDGLAALDWRAAVANAGAIRPGQWVLAALATALSFLALGRYDEVVHSALGTGVEAAQARRSGMAAIAISQMTGAGLLTGSLTRWRLVPDLSLTDAGRVTLAVTVSFLISWAALTGTAILLFWPAAPGQGLFAWAGIGAASVFLALSLLKPRLHLGTRQLALPPVALSLRILLLSALDTLAAATALYLFLPAGVQPGFLTFLPAFLLALGAGLCLGTPGGIGPFELTLMAFLPDLPAAPLAAALLSYRLVYFAAPALIAGGLILLAGPGAEGSPPPVAPAPVCFARAQQAESNLFLQGQHQAFQLPGAAQSAWLTARAGQARVALFDPARGKTELASLLSAFAARATDAGLMPCLYKITPRIAAFARRAGWCLHPVAEEFWLDLADFSPDGPARAGLRRKLRQAERAGLRIEALAPGQMTLAPWAELETVNRDWSVRHGGERGFSMGRYAKDYLAGQRLYLAWQADRLVAFISFHAGHREWTLDLVRPTVKAPDGTVAVLILAALADARAAGIARLSLAAAPLPAFGLSGLAGTLVARLPGGAAHSGLRQFKMLFAPKRTRLYIAARSRPALIWSALEIARAVRWSAPLPRKDTANPQTIQDRPENLAFEVS